MCDKKPAKAKKCRMFHAKHCYTTNTKLTSTEFTTMHLNLNIQLKWTALNAHLTLHIVSWMFCNRVRQQKQHRLLKQWNYYWSIDLQWNLTQLLVNTKRTQRNHSGTTNCGKEEWKQKRYKLRWTKTGLNRIAALMHVVWHFESKNVLVMQRKETAMALGRKEWKQMHYNTHWTKNSLNQIVVVTH